MVDQIEIDSRAREMRSWYDGHRFRCQMFQERFTTHLLRALRLAGLEEAKVESRTKSLDSLIGKAVKVVPPGDFKYADPRTEITDLVGARVLVPLSTDLPAVAELVRRSYDVEEETSRGDEAEHGDVPGYRSLHYLVRLNPADQADVDFVQFGGMVVEIQVRTTLQHAWASLQHDVRYKTDRPPSPAISRRLTALAGLLELADREFVSVRQAHAEVRDLREHRDAGVGRAMPAGPLTASALRHLVETVFGEEDPAAQEWFVELKAVINSLGLTTSDDVARALGDWRDRAPEVALAVRPAMPWANSAFLLDLLLRLSMRERYLELRATSTPEDPMDAEEAVAVRAEFLEDLARTDQALAKQS